MRKKSKSLMQSEIFIIIMIIIALLYVITAMYASKLERSNDSLAKENFYLKEINTTCWAIDKEMEKKDRKIKEQNSTIKKLINENNKSKKMIDDLNITLQAMLKKFRDLNATYHYEKEEFKKHKKPPLITLSEDKKEFRFKVGKAHLTKRYKNALLKEKFPEIINNIIKYNCNVIEVYGYTDTQPFNKANNIDDKLHQCIDSDCSIDRIRTHSNLELGMKRAISIVHFLKQQQAKGNISKDIIIKPYSAGQFIDENGKIAKRNSQDNKKRRRIEIRLSRSKE